MPARKQKKTVRLPEILELARPSKPVRFKAKVVSGIAILYGEDGAVAVVPVDEVCRLAERLNLIVEGFKC
ncbi:hypothetical protein [Hyperthermus butylicus]|uniref:Uncharacterized protein n=1 Tax=Hyperthermus butylicus (strain DSM 5456 / JCM 9403 / PLM1-5) TaxID=415426 RepID=A2BM06_HYPBU|nr:hypothetical protein [Hyperthermus butylicus]ABM81017.1 hypothetical protein Hbut_1183 [Hyperthermus butylicus DSM 5456]